MNTLLLAAKGKKEIKTLAQYTIDTSVQEALKITFGVFMVLISIALVILILVQKGTNENVGALSGSSETYYGKNKMHSKERTLKIVTLVLFIFMLLFAVTFALIARVGQVKVK